MKALLILLILALIYAIGQANGEIIISLPPPIYDKQVNASEIMEKIKRGEPVDYSNVNITGDINLDQLNLDLVDINRNGYHLKKVHSIVNIEYSLINGDVDFSDSLFQSEINIRGCNFTGKADFSNSEFSKPVSIVASQFNQIANFQNAQFEHVNFMQSMFKKPADFNDITIKDYGGFYNVQFWDDAYFSWARFNQIFLEEARFNHTDFSGSIFNQSADFGGLLFKQEADFFLTNFKQPAIFREARFNQSAYFDGSIFNQSADFGEAQFNQEANFVWTNFRQPAIFREARFNQSAYFDGSIFNQSADFGEAQFNQSSNFSSSDFRGFADFSKTQFDKSAFFNRSNFNNSATFDGCQCKNSFDFSYAKGKDYISFERARIASANFNWAKFSGDLFFESSKIGRLNLTRAEFGNIFLKRINVDHLDYDEVGYLSLIGNLRRTNFIDDANQFYYSYRDSRRSNLNTLYGSLDYFLMLFYGYGLKPERPVIWAFVFIAFFAALFWWRQGILPVREGEPESEANRFTPLEAMAFSGMTFLSGGKLVFDPPEYRIAPGRRWRDVQICKALFVWERLMGMILIVMFAIAVSKTIILGS